MLDMSASGGSLMNPTADEELQKRIAVRASADKAVIEWRTSEAIRR